jgi:hypothetical protein
MTTFTWAPPRAADDVQVKYHYGNFCRLCIYISILALPSLPFSRYDCPLNCTYSPARPAQSLGRPPPPTLQLSRAGRPSVYRTPPIALRAICRSESRPNHMQSGAVERVLENTDTFTASSAHAFPRPTDTSSQHISLRCPVHSWQA